MPDQEDLETRLRSYLARGATRPAPSELEQRILAKRPVSRTRWVPQVLAAAALLLFAIGLGIAFQRSRGASTLPAISPYPTATAAPSSNTSPTPSVMPSPTAGSGLLGLSSIHMTSSTTGWATGDTDNHVNGPNSGVFRTTDGGAHWQAVTPRNQAWLDFFSEGPTPAATLPSASYQIAAYFLDADRAWVAGIIGTTTDSRVTVFSTSDGGAHWQAGTAFSGIESAGAFLDFVDSRHGWLLLGIHAAIQQERVALYGTTDGSRWSLLMQTTACNLDGLTFISASTGWTSSACAETGPAISVTHDGGRTWQPQSLPFPPPSVEYCGCDSYAPVFFSSQGGIIPTNGSIMFITADGGRNWSLRRLPGHAAFQSFVDASHGWAADPDTGTVYASADGGQTWAAVSTIQNLTNVPQLNFIDRTTGYALRGPGKSPMLKTTDGGHTWKEIPITL